MANRDLVQLMENPLDPVLVQEMDVLIPEASSISPQFKVDTASLTGSQTFCEGMNLTPFTAPNASIGESGDLSGQKGPIHQSRSHPAIGQVLLPGKRKRIAVISPTNRHSSGSLPSDPLLMTSAPDPATGQGSNINIQENPLLRRPSGQLKVQIEDDGYCSSVTYKKSTEGTGEGDEDPTKAVGNHNAPSPSEGEDGERETWGKSVDFLLSIIGFAVDLANVQRFPYYCYKNGGGAFLIPYFLMLIFGAIPIFYMELLLGQSLRQGPISMWRICPLFKGVGYCAVTVSYFVSWYYNITMGWSLHYTINSFSSPLPWTTCHNAWNTENCFNPVTNNGTRPPNATSPATEYYRRSVLAMEEHSIDDLGELKVDLLLYVAIIYCLLYLIIFKGIRSSGKVVWVTATLPYLILAVLLGRGVFLEGAIDGIKYYLVPNFSKLWEVEVWSDAAKQIFFSSGAGFGVHLTYASYNNFHNNCFRDCIITSIVNSFTSIFAGFVIFTFLGSMAHTQKRNIADVVAVGPGLVFEVYPEAIGSLPGANLWSILFFIMLIMLGVDSAMGGLECVITGISDEYKNWFRQKKHRKEWFKVGIVFSSFIVSIINITRGGIYTYTFLDSYAAGVSLLLAVLFEVLAVSWVYGLDQLCKDAAAMLGKPPSLFWRVCWKFISPLLIAIIIILDLSHWAPLTLDKYEYPAWAQYFGLVFTFIPITFLPILAIVALVQFPGTCERKLAYAITPLNEHDIIRNEGYVKRFGWRHWLHLW